MVETPILEIRKNINRINLDETHFTAFLFEKKILKPRSDGKLVLDDLHDEEAKKIVKHWDHSLKVYQAWMLGHPAPDQLPLPEKSAGKEEKSEPVQPVGEPLVSEPTQPLPPTEGPKTLAGVHAALVRRFDPAQVKLKPGPTNEGKTQAIAFLYADRKAYQDRLDEVVGPDGWEVEYRPIMASGAAIVCRLTILGHAKEEVGEAKEGKDNAWTSSATQAFKRACASHGIGRYLSGLPKPWAEFDAQKKCFKNPSAVILKLYENGKQK